MCRAFFWRVQWLLPRGNPARGAGRIGQHLRHDAGTEQRRPDPAARSTRSGAGRRRARPDGLWDGFTGAGYLDMGGNAGDAFAFDVDAPEAGVYTLTFRHANTGTGR